MNIPLNEMIKSVPGVVGIRLEEELPFKLIQKDGDFEIRHYDNFTLAQTTVFGSYEEAGETAFKKLAEFIFGKNSGNLTASMTTPVFMDKIKDGWTMSFYLSPEVQWMEPNDPLVKVVSHPAKDVAVLRYSGSQSAEAMEEKAKELLSLLESKGLKAISEVWWAQYDQPLSLPLTKRNEALVKIVVPV